MQSAEQRLREEGIRGEVFLFKNNTDSAGNSYGCHENYLVEREGDFSKFTDVLIPFLVTRQIYAGAGKVLQTARGAMYCIAQRAEHIWEGVSSATTRSRPIINTRDEPHADAERFRRLHVIVGDSNMSEYATFLKVGATSIILRMLEEDAAPWRDLTLENPIRAIREISHDITCRRRVRLANGRELSAVEIQTEYLTRALRFAKRRGLPPLEQRALEMWEHVMTHLEDDPLKLRTEVDWVIKHHLIEAYRKRGDLPLTHPRVSLLDLAYHDVTRSRSLYYLLERRGQVDRMVDGRRDHRRDEHPAADDTGPVARRVHQAGQGTQARLHGRLGAPEAQRPGAADRAVQGPVQVARRAGRAADRLVVAARPARCRRSGRARSREILEERRRPAARARRPRCRARARVRADAADRAVAVGDRVVVNTTAVELGLGTGGWHVVHWNLAASRRGPRSRDRHRDEAAVHEPAGRRRRTSEPPTASDRSTGMPVVVAGLHSQVAAIAVAFKHARPDARLVYVMTDGGALPIALSDLVCELRERGLLDATVTCGHAFGGDYEAVSVYGALAVARHVADADAVVVAMGPGSAGTADPARLQRRSRSGPSSTRPTALGGYADRRTARLVRRPATAPSRRLAPQRHDARRSRRAAGCTVALPRVGGDEERQLRADLAAAGIDTRHELVDVAPVGIVDLLDATRDLHVVSMGRPAADDPCCSKRAAAAAGPRRRRRPSDLRLT